MEILRDPSHTRGLCVAELFGLLQQDGCGLIVDESSREKTQLEVGLELVAWMESTKTSSENQEEIIKTFEEELKEDGKPCTGMHAYRDEKGNICFKHKWTVAIGLKE